MSCGNCTRCPYLAISLDKNLHPVTDAERCVGCSLCSLQCFVGAIRMRERTAKEKRSERTGDTAPPPQGTLTCAVGLWVTL